MHSKLQQQLDKLIENYSIVTNILWLTLHNILHLQKYTLPPNLWVSLENKQQNIAITFWNDASHTALLPNTKAVKGLCLILCVKTFSPRNRIDSQDCLNVNSVSPKKPHAWKSDWGFSFSNNNKDGLSVPLFNVPSFPQQLRVITRSPRLELQQHQVTWQAEIWTKIHLSYMQVASSLGGTISTTPQSISTVLA